MKGESEEVSKILEEAPPAREALMENFQNLHNVADYCQENYLKAGVESDKALEETKNFTTQSLASVAYQISSLASSVLRLLDAQTIQLRDMESSVNLIGQAVAMHREKVSRREIGVFTTVRRIHRNHKLLPPATESTAPKYNRRPISYSDLDGLGHGVKDSGKQLERTGTTRKHGGSTRSTKAPEPVQCPVAPNPSSSFGKPVAPPSVPTWPLSHECDIITTLLDEGPPPPPAPPPPQASEEEDDDISAPDPTPDSSMEHMAPPPPPLLVEDLANQGPVGTMTPPVAPPPPPLAPPLCLETVVEENSFPPPSPPPPSSDDVILPPTNENLELPGPPPPPPPIQDVEVMIPPPPPYPPPTAPPPSSSSSHLCLPARLQHLDLEIPAPPPPPLLDSEEGFDDIMPPLPPPVDYEIKVPPAHQEKVVALYSYEAAKSEDVSFKEGDVIFLTRRHDDGWCEGVVNGNQGFFPGNYVQPIS